VPVAARRSGVVNPHDPAESDDVDPAGSGAIEAAGTGALRPAGARSAWAGSRCALWDTGGAMTDDRNRARRTPRPVRRDRRGRGPRTPLLPAEVPASRTRAEQFDQAVLDAVAEMEERWPTEVASIEFAVDEVPPLPSGPVLPANDVVVDGGVPLSRFLPPAVDSRGRPTKARIVLYRRPLEVRAQDSGELSDLVAEVLDEQLSAVLGNGSTT
jgi:hypothetical protein